MLRAVFASLSAPGRGALVVNIGSVLGRVTFPFLGLYGASKFAGRGIITDSYRYELSQAGRGTWFSCSRAPTRRTFLQASSKPADAARAVTLTARLARSLPRCWRTFKGMLAKARMPRTRRPVAEAITRLVEQPTGSRPRAHGGGASRFGVDARQCPKPRQSRLRWSRASALGQLAATAEDPSGGGL